MTINFSHNFRVVRILLPMPTGRASLASVPVDVLVLALMLMNTQKGHGYLPINPLKLVTSTAVVCNVFFSGVRSSWAFFYIIPLAKSLEFMPHSPLMFLFPSGTYWHPIYCMGHPNPESKACSMGPKCFKPSHISLTTQRWRRLLLISSL